SIVSILSVPYLTLADPQQTTSEQPGRPDSSRWVRINGQSYVRDSLFNIPQRVLDLVGRSLHNQPYHPLCLIKRRIFDFMNKNYSRRNVNAKQYGSPLFSMHDNLSPVVTTRQNFDSLLIPEDHPSRAVTDTYYVNETTLLRSHTSAHQLDMLSSGLNAFLLAGDVYRRDDVDSLHYPVFHQLEGVRLFSADELFRDAIDPSGCLQLLEDIPVSSPYAKRHKYPLQAVPSFMLPPDRQPQHTNETAKRLEFELKTVLQSLARFLFGPDLQIRWVEAYFPFTHPSWELEVKTRVGYTGDSVEEWTELLGCGLMRQEILERAGITSKVGYAFGLGLERWAMQLYHIPDIRLFWTRDSGFLHQFETDDIHRRIVYRPVSVFPQCVLDLSFWLNDDPSQTAVKSEQQDEPDAVSRAIERDFYDIVRSVAGDLIEQVRLIDRFSDPKTGRRSHCYRLIYRDQHRTLTMDEVRPIHDQIAQSVRDRFGVQIR
ncbi:Phenylalanyl-tRNA synthetase alpha chain, partial [Fasciolopsis buskii]